MNHLGQPIGPSVGDWKAPPFPAREPLAGRYCRLEPLEARHARELWAAYSLDTECRNWTYLVHGPYDTFEEYAAWVDHARSTADPLFFALVSPTAVGVAAYLRIAPEAGSIEVGHINSSPLLQRTRAAAERLGFTYEGTFRQATVYKGRNRDTAWYAVIDREWPALRDAFERWLDPSNFDAQGRQRTKLKL